MWDDGVPTITTDDQRQLERRVRSLYAEFLGSDSDIDNGRLFLDREAHAKYLHDGLGTLPAGFSSLDASRPWLCYWILHSLALLGKPLPPMPARDTIIAFLASCQHASGGFGGGPYQMPHLATTYASVAALVTLGGRDALCVIDRPGLLRFFLDMCVPIEHGGGMTMHHGGEVDVRGCYCALAVCQMVGLEGSMVADACALAHYVASCQGMEGGIGGEPWNEAPGGYSFCGYAALVLAKRPHAVHEGTLTAWAARMQGWMEGGFMGRSCKLVDGCYSLWQGGIFPLLSSRFMAFSDTREWAAAAGDAPTATCVDQYLVAHDAVGESQYALDITVSPPETVARRIVEDLQVLRDAAVEESLSLEAAFRAVTVSDQESAGVEAQKSLKRDVLSALQRASDADDAVDRAQEHAESATLAATSLLPNKTHSTRECLCYDPDALQLWVLLCCQGKKGGCRDKPGKHVDYYHTCYCLSGLASAQAASGATPIGGDCNRLAVVDPLCNVVADKLNESLSYFTS